MIASSDDSTMAASRARTSSARLRSVTSRKTRTAPSGIPLSSRMGAALSSMGRSVAVPGDEDGVVRQPHDRPLPQGTEGGVLDRLAGSFVDDVEDVRKRAAQGLRLGPPGQGLGDAVHERDPALGIGADHRVTDAGERDAQPFRLLPQRLFGAPARKENALGVLQGDRPQQFLLVVVLPPLTASEYCRGERGARHARPDLCERRVAGRGSVVAERREAAIVRRAQLLRPGYTGRLPGPGPGLLPQSRCAGRSVRRRRRRPDGLAFMCRRMIFRMRIAVPFARESDVEIPDHQLEEAGQQIGVIDLPAVGRVAVGAGAGVHADPLAVLGGEPRQRQVVQVYEAVQEVPGRVDLDRQPSLREVDLDLVRSLPQAVADFRLVLAQQVIDELFAGIARGSRRPGT